MTVDQIQTEIESAAEESKGLFSRLGHSAKRYAYAGIGVVVVAAEKASEIRHEKVEKGIDRLAERGHDAKDRRLQGLTDAAGTTRDVAVGMTRQVTTIAGSAVGSVTSMARDRIGIASATDVEVVTQQLDELNQRIEEGAAA